MKERFMDSLIILVGKQRKLREKLILMRLLALRYGIIDGFQARQYASKVLNRSTLCLE